MARSKQAKKTGAKKAPVFFEDKIRRRVYRDEKGRFIKRYDAEKQDIAPEFQTVTQYRNEKGVITSKDKVKRSKKPVVKRVKRKGKLTPLSSAPIEAKTLTTKAGAVSPKWRQEFWQSVKTNLLKDVATKKSTAVKVNGEIRELNVQSAVEAGDFLTEMDYAILEFFYAIGESPVLFVDSAETNEAAIYDFDSIQFNEAVDEISEDFPDEAREFKKKIKAIKNTYFKK